MTQTSCKRRVQPGQVKRRLNHRAHLLSLFRLLVLGCFANGAQQASRLQCVTILPDRALSRAKAITHAKSHLLGLSGLSHDPQGPGCVRSDKNNRTPCLPTSLGMRHLPRPSFGRIPILVSVTISVFGMCSYSDNVRSNRPPCGAVSCTAPSVS